MTLTGFLILLLVAAIVGSLGQALAGYSLGGCLVSIIVGFIGAYLGLWLAQTLGLPLFISFEVNGQTIPIIWSIIGAGIFSLIVGLISRRRPI